MNQPSSTDIYIAHGFILVAEALAAWALWMLVWALWMLVMNVLAG